MKDFIKSKILILFLLFTITLLLTSLRKFNKLVEPLSEEELYEKKITKCVCASKNCNKLLPTNFNTFNGVGFDRLGQNLSAYCCASCRDSGGMFHDEGCVTHEVSLEEGFTSKSVKEGHSDDNLTNSDILLINNIGNCGGKLLDQGSNTCYGEDSDYISSESNRGANRFKDCAYDPECGKAFNSIQMMSTLAKEPSENASWKDNVWSILKNDKFIGEGEESIYNEWKNAGYSGILKKDHTGKPFCRKICEKASDPNNENNFWKNEPTDGEYNEAVWGAKFLCKGCVGYDSESAQNSLADPNMQIHTCNEGEGNYNTSKELLDQINWKWVDTHGKEASDKFIDSWDEDSQTYLHYGTIISTDVEIPYSAWSKDRTRQHIDFFCRSACANKLSENCFQNEDGELTYNNNNIIRTQCAAACKKRLPTPNSVNIIPPLVSEQAYDMDILEDEPMQLIAPDINEDDFEPPCKNGDVNDPLTVQGTCYEDGTSMSWQNARDELFSIY
jgi:hypothetical protein